MVDTISPVIIGKLIEAHRENDNAKFDAYVDLVIQKYEEAGKDNAVAIIKKRAYGDLDDYSSIVVLDSNC